jgi:hypothetical protein
VTRFLQILGAGGISATLDGTAWRQWLTTAPCGWPGLRGGGSRQGCEAERCGVARRGGGSRLGEVARRRRKEASGQEFGRVAPAARGQWPSAHAMEVAEQGMAMDPVTNMRQRLSFGVQFVNLDNIFVLINMWLLVVVFDEISSNFI